MNYDNDDWDSEQKRNPYSSGWDAEPHDYGSPYSSQSAPPPQSTSQTPAREDDPNPPADVTPYEQEQAEQERLNKLYKGFGSAAGQQVQLQDYSAAGQKGAQMAQSVLGYLGVSI